MRINLATLNANGQVSVNVAGQLTKILDFQVPQGQFFALDTKRPQIIRLAAVGTSTRTLVGGDITAGQFAAAALTDQPVRPPPRYIPTWPSADGYTFKVFLRLQQAGGNGPWTRATINAVDWGTRVLTLALPASLVDHAGASKTLAVADVVGIRISYINAAGHLIWRRETPDNAQTISARTAWDVSTYILGVRDQLDEGGRIKFDRVIIWVPQQCNWRWYLNSPVPWDFDPTLSASEVEINAVMIGIAEAHAGWISLSRSLGVEPAFRNLYSLYLSQLQGGDEAYPL